MAIQKGFVDRLVILLFVFSLVSLESATAKQSSLPLNRSSFPDGFIFGTASSSYQYEGAAESDGRSPSIWDTYTHKMPGRIADRSNGDVAIDFYHRYKEDVHKMKGMGTDAFRFSISWSRILPSGKLSGGVNKKGVDFYNNLINVLFANGQQPFVTLFHWDLPQALEDEYGGFLSPRIVKDFQDFAEVCFKEFGDRVKHWITLNEPSAYAAGGYDWGQSPPARCSKWVNKECKEGNSATEPYQVGHNLLLAHAAASNLYRSKYKASQKGTIGITLVGPWGIPYSNSKADIQATKRLIDFMFGWYMDPLTFGDYPLIMHTIVGERLPKFTKEQSKMVKGSAEFIGTNYYTTSYVLNISPNTVNISYSNDAHAETTRMRNGVPIGPAGPLSWLYIYPKGIRDLLVYTKKKYNNPPIYITENGFDDNSTLPTKGALNDTMRILYLYRHFLFLQRAIKEGVNVKGYFAWSLLDNFEWNSGYSVRFGLYYVDYKNGLKRYPKQSALWFKEFLQHKKKN